MLRLLLFYLERHPAPTREPTTGERAILHALYLAGLGEATWLLLAMARRVPGIRTGAVDPVIEIGLCGAAFMLWSVTRRRVRTEMWFIDHLIWFTWSQMWLASLFVGTLLLFAGIALFALAFPPVAYLIYAPWIVAWPLALWFAWRIARGYRAFLRDEPVGHFALPSDGVRNWGIYDQAAIIPDMRGAARRGPSVTPPGGRPAA